MIAVHKFTLHMADEQIISIVGYKDILCVKEQDGDLVLYAVVDTEKDNVKNIKVQIRGTGHPLRGVNWANYLDTVMTLDGALVWHVFVAC